MLLTAVDTNRLSTVASIGPSTRLDTDKLPGHLIIGSLRQDPQDGAASVVYVQVAPQRDPACAATAIDYIAQLHDTTTYQSVLAGEAVVLDAYVKLIRIWLIFITEDTTEKTMALAILNISTRI